MKYVVWLIRLWYAAWMIPAGLEHFIHIFPQPGYYTTRVLAHEMLFALLHSHLFDIVKAVELLTGIAVLFGFFTPAMLLVCMPVAFCVFWWDAPLSAWNTGSVLAGGRVLASNILLCVAFFACFRSMFALRSVPGAGVGSSLRPLVTVARIAFGAWMLANGVNYFFLPMWSLPVGHEPLSIELMGAFMHSGLMTVAMLIQLVTGALILAGVFTPAALCVVMATSACGLYWALLEHQPLPLLLAFLAFAVNGLLMLAYLGYYQGALLRSPLSLGESEPAMIWDTLYVNQKGRTSREHFIGALIPLALVAGWYAQASPQVYPQWSLLVLLFPAIVLHARRLHDMGHSGWLLIIPTALTIPAMMIWDHRLDLGAQLNTALPVAALVAFVVIALWGCVGKGKAETNMFGPAAVA